VIGQRGGFRILGKRRLGGDAQIML
jgi:hypothetical protein